MSVIPLTLSISLCLIFTFVVFFLREHTRHSFSGAARKSPVPLGSDAPRAIVNVHHDRVAHPPAA